jgi:hypothetical protein
MNGYPRPVGRLDYIPASVGRHLRSDVLGDLGDLRGVDPGGLYPQWTVRAHWQEQCVSQAE